MPVNISCRCGHALGLLRYATAPQLTVDGEIEQGEVAFALFKLGAGPGSPTRPSA